MQSANQASTLNSNSLGVLMGWESHPWDESWQSVQKANIVTRVPEKEAGL